MIAKLSAVIACSWVVTHSSPSTLDVGFLVNKPCHQQKTIVVLNRLFAIALLHQFIDFMSGG